MKIHGIDFIISRTDTELWVPPIGVKVGLYCGPLTKKFVKFWKYRWGMNWDTAPNAWRNSEDRWFTIKLPFFIGPFLSISIRNFGFYIGFKIDDDDGLIPTARFTLRRR